MNEYNFDPMTGEPIRKEEPAQVPQPEPGTESPAQPETVQEPAAETPQETTYHYVRPEFGETRFQEPEQPSYQYSQPQPETTGYNYYQAPPAPKPKKEPKPLTTKNLAPIVAVVAVVALVLGAVGGFFGARYRNGGVVPSGTAVIYKTTKLKDDKGDTVKEALTIEQVAALVKDSVVEITTEQIVTGSFMQQYVSEGAGSGVIITADGYIVTNNHVIEEATNINVRLADGKEYAAKLVGADAKTDLAVIKIEAADLTPAAYGSSAELEVGETVVAVGNPLGKLGGTVTSGIISALDREVTIDNTAMNLLQTDTAINPGNSGGGLFNTSGQLVGIVNAKSAGEEIEGLGFSIPIDTAEKVIEDLIGHGYVTNRVDPGFTFVEINDSMTAMMYRVSEMGLYISAVAENSDAAKAGFKSGDYVVSIEDKKVSTEAEANAVIDGKSVGDTLTLVIKRSGKEKTIEMTLSEYVPSATETENQTQTQPQIQNPFGSIFGN